MLKDCGGKTRHGRRLWHCICECGEDKDVTSSDLLGGHVRSCGCLLVESRRKGGLSTTLKIEGKRFGKLIAIRKTGERQGGAIIWECLCDCGRTKNVRAGDLNIGAIKSCGCSYKEMTKSERWTKNTAKAGLCSRSNLRAEDIPNELIEMKVMQININRQLKEMTL